MDWKILSENNQIDDIIRESYINPVVIFKHSTRCSISHVAKSRLEREESPENMDFYFLDLLQFRNLSNHVSEKFSVPHESPQVLLIRNGECIYDESHNGIFMGEIIEQGLSSL